MVWLMGMCVLYPQYTLLFQLFGLLDIMRMWMKVYGLVWRCKIQYYYYVDSGVLYQIRRVTSLQRITKYLSFTTLRCAICINC